MRILLIILLFCSAAYSQEGKYQIERIDSKRIEGEITISHHLIQLDSVDIPVTKTLVHLGEQYFSLSGCIDGVSFRGNAILTKSSTQQMEGMNKQNQKVTRYREYYNLFLEIRMQNAYYSSKYFIYYDHD